MAVTSTRFDQFFQQLYGYEPFPWQRRLVARVLEGEGWPRVISLPTSSGKTAVIDIAVFALAHEAEAPARRTPRRIFFVVDRRIVVDEAYRRAQALAFRLRDALGSGSGVLHEVATDLMRLGGEVPLEAAIMRGGMYLNHDWARNPAQPLVCVSTVDQVGSRLLFRGYGLDSDRPNNMLSIQASLVGVDALIILDEAHVSAAFAHTLEWIGRYRTWAERPINAPWHALFMSATLNRGVADEAFADSEEDRAHPELGRRLRASKPARLVEVEVSQEPAGGPDANPRRVEARNQQLLVECLCAEAVRFLDEGRARVIGVVVNRVLTARQVVERLKSLRAVDALLLTGRIRPVDRDALLDRYLPRMKAGRERQSSDAPLLVVATQTVEVGADLDFDALVTECAPLDALRQRFGRLDRFGQLQAAPAAIVALSDQVSRGAEDPVYGPALARTWEWLTGLANARSRQRRSRGSQAQPVVDMGITALEPHMPTGEQLAALCAPARPAPVMLPGHLDLWAQTSPRPRPDPDVGLFLHGPESGPPDVQVVWRADLDPEDPAYWADTVALLPPLVPEAMPVPLYAVRAWLVGAGSADIADVEGQAPGAAHRPHEVRQALRWAGPGADGTKPVEPDEIRPGDTIVVPSEYGGADDFGWAPLSTKPVRDVATDAYRRSRAYHVLRLHPRLVGELLPRASRDALGYEEQAREEHAVEERAKEEWATLQERLRQFGSETLSEEELDRLADEVLATLATAEWVAASVRDTAAALLTLPGTARRRLNYPDRQGIVITGRAAPGADGRLTDESDASVFTRPVALAEHQQGVAKTVATLAHACGLTHELQRDLAMAAALHDLGKLDPRFQVMLYGGDEVAAAIGEPRAKSGTDLRDRRQVQRVWERSGLPRGYRHEATSLALVSAAPEWLQGAYDRDLVLHLIASHHGCARPFMPVVSDEGAVQYRMRWQETQAAIPPDGLSALDAGVAERFWRLTRRYGWYGLAYLEAILRLGDHRQSEKERETRHE